MPRAIWNGVVVAEGEVCEAVEGCVYFPANAVEVEHLEPSGYGTVCPVRGRARHFDLVAADGTRARNAAWMYREPQAAAAGIRDHVAFRCPPVAIEP
jgi:uncharacterized protein (DUF427 family)